MATTLKPAHLELPFDKAKIEDIIRRFPTPLYVYDEKGIRASARRLNTTFAWHESFKEYFAVKATPNPTIVKLLREEGLGADCSSYPELILGDRAGLRGEELMFTSNNTLAKDYRKAIELGAIVNLDDITHIEYLEQEVGLPELVCVRYNPGPLREGNAIIGQPEEAKYGFTREQLFAGYRHLQRKGVTRFGLHTMVASDERNADFFIATAQMLFELALEIATDVGIRLEFVNLGGGIGIPYRPEDTPVDLGRIGEGVRELYDQLIRTSDLHPLKIFMENGRLITGPSGYLITQAIHEKHIYKHYVGVDACMANLMRPGMYGAYHHITVLGKEEEAHDQVSDVVGSLCENNDKFAIDRPLPRIEKGDFLVIHGAGAHGHAMGFQYNGRLRSAEVLLREDGSVTLIRRAETTDDYFATLSF